MAPGRFFRRRVRFRPTRSRFERSISVPDGVDLNKVSAAMQDGILTVTMPKAEVRKPRQITVD
ncbi:MAG: Hsp20 family protein [Verrucomicrobia bacterium]|nr:Hsp20 family protein [Verrucomicrobiota bacterium]